MTMTIDRPRHRRLASAAAPRKHRVTLGRIGLALLAAAVFSAWIAALPPLLASTGLSWRTDHCGRRGYRDPVTGRPAGRPGDGLGATCSSAAAGPTR